MSSYPLIFISDFHLAVSEVLYFLTGTVGRRRQDLCAQMADSRCPS